MGPTASGEMGGLAPWRHGGIGRKCHKAPPHRRLRGGGLRVTHFVRGSLAPLAATACAPIPGREISRD
jgi:hypothetical protein